MPKGTSRTPSHASQITFKNKDDVYPADSGTLPARGSSKTSKTSNRDSKPNLKDSKSSVKESKSNVKDSKASVKDSKGSVRTSKSTLPPKSKKSSSQKSLDKIVTSTPEGSLQDLDVSEVSPIERVGSRTLEIEPIDFVPMPYTFRAPGPPLTRELKKLPAKCPPYYLQLDHTLAVIWCLFADTEVGKPLGIVQLQWALTFLNGIYNKKGTHPKDVALCIQAIEDELIDQYADMVDEVQFIKKPPVVTDLRKSRSKDKMKDKGKEKGKDKGKTGSKSKSSKDKASSKDKMKTESQIDMESDIEQEEKEEGTGEVNENARTPSPSRTGSTTDQSQLEDSCNEVCMNKTCMEDDKDDLVMKQVPFSVNYAEMISRSPPDIEQLFPNTRSSKSLSGASGAKKSISGLDQAVSRENIMEFLKAWRREQVEKIQAELKRLKSIENFIGNAETENFAPYLDDKQLDSLVNQKVSKQPAKSRSREKKWCH